MAKVTKHLGLYPENHQIYAARLEVMRISRRKAAATRFVKGRHQRLEFGREPGNPVDPNAIKLFGCWKGWFGREKRAFIGYMPREVANVVADFDVFDVIRPRLERTLLRDKGFVGVYYQFTGPKKGAKEFKAALGAVADRAFG